MRILVDALSVAPGGGVVVAFGLLSALSEFNTDDEYTVLVKDPLLPDSRSWPGSVRFETVGKLAVPAATRTVWEQTQLTRIMRNGYHDVFLGVGGFGMMRGNWPQIVIVQNSLFYVREPLATVLGRQRIRAQRRVQLSTLRNGATGVCVSSAIRDQIRRYVAEDARLPVIPNAVEYILPSFDPSRYRNPAVPVVLWVGSAAPHKNPAELVQAVSYVEAEHGSPVELRFAGAIPESLRTELVNQAMHLGLATSLVFLGQLSRRDLLEQYRIATVFVSTSRVESSSLPALEATASGTPVILSDIDAHREIAPEALLYQSGAPRQLARRLENLFDDSSLRQRVAEAGWSLVRGRTWHAAAMAYRQEFELAIASRRSRGQQSM